MFKLANEFLESFDKKEHQGETGHYCGGYLVKIGSEIRMEGGALYKYSKCGQVIV